MWTSSFPGLSRPGLLRFPGLSTCGRRNSLHCTGIEPGTPRAGVCGWQQCDNPYGDRTWDPPSRCLWLAAVWWSVWGSNLGPSEQVPVAGCSVMIRMGIEPGTLRAGVCRWLRWDNPYGDRTWDPPSDGPVFSPLRCTSTLRCSDCSTSIWASSACTFLKLGIYRQFSLTTLLSSSACTFLKLSRYRQSLLDDTIILIGLHLHLCFLADRHISSMSWLVGTDTVDVVNFLNNRDWNRRCPTLTGNLQWNNV